MQYDNLEPSYVFFLVGSYFFLASTLAPLAVVLAYCFGQISRIELWVWGILSVGWAVLVAATESKLRRKRAEFERSGSRNFKAFLTKPQPWQKLQPVELLCVSGDVYTLRLDRPRKWWRLDTSPVHAKVRCTPEQADWLRIQMRKWLADAQATAK